MGWATATWHKLLPVPLLAKAWGWMVQSHGDQGPPGAKVVGPLGAFLATCRRIGWTMNVWNILVDSRGQEIDVLKVPPGWIQKLVDAATADWIWKRVGSCPSLAPLAEGGCLQPVTRLLRGKALSKLEKSCLKAVVSGAEWPAQRLHAVGLIEGAACRACGLEGTAKHRHAGCPAMRQVLNGHGRIFELHDLGLGSQLFWDRCLVPSLEPLFGRPVAEHNEHWEI